MASSQDLVSKTIKARLAFSGKSKTDLAEHLTMGREALYRRLIGKKVWNLDELDSVAKFLGLRDAWQIIDLAENEDPSNQRLVS
jgi:DNA-binding phage protein